MHYTSDRYAVIHKHVGETPLQALERFRTNAAIPATVPLAYAGRLDPLASGALLILIGEECKQQTFYHQLDKSYTFSVLFGVGSDTYDPLGRLLCSEPQPISATQLSHLLQKFRGVISLPYPPFSAKTVQGKPLHTWTLEGRLNEITVPYRESTVYRLQLDNIHTWSGTDLYTAALDKIQSVDTVTDTRKSLGADFRRTEVLADWNAFKKHYGTRQFSVANLTCVASSGTYMRSLAHHIGEQLGTPAMAFSIHRSTIGRYQPLFSNWGFFTQRFLIHE